MPREWFVSILCPFESAFACVAKILGTHCRFSDVHDERRVAGPLRLFLLEWDSMDVDEREAAVSFRMTAIPSSQVGPFTVTWEVEFPDYDETTDVTDASSFFACIPNALITTHHIHTSVYT